MSNAVVRYLQLAAEHRNAVEPDAQDQLWQKMNRLFITLTNSEKQAIWAMAAKASAA